MNHPTRKQHLNIGTQSRYEGAKKEDSIGQQYDWLATPYVTDLPPRRRRCCRCKKEGRSYPSIVGFRGMEMRGNRGDGSCNDSLDEVLTEVGVDEMAKTYSIESSKKDSDLKRSSAMPRVRNCRFGYLLP